MRQKRLNALYDTIARPLAGLQEHVRASSDGLTDYATISKSDLQELIEALHVEILEGVVKVLNLEKDLR